MLGCAAASLMLPVLQMGVCYKVAATGDDYVKVWAANTRVNEVVGQWQTEHGLIVSATTTTATPPAKGEGAE